MNYVALEGYDYDCRRCGGRHVIACCHASRHNMCDRCVADQHSRRFALDAEAADQ